MKGYEKSLELSLFTAVNMILKDSEFWESMVANFQLM
jgi:hypothetical protein